MFPSSTIYEGTSSIVVGIIPAASVDKEAFLYYDTKRNDSYFLYKESAYMRVKVVLQCTETGDRNYITTKNKRNNLFVALMRFFNKIIKSLNNLLHRLSHHLFLLS